MSGAEARAAMPVRRRRFRLRASLRAGLASLWRHRLRSLLTVLGIVFGVASVIAMLAIGEGASHEAQEQISRLGSRNIILRSMKPADEEKVGMSSHQAVVLEYGLLDVDLVRLRDTVPGVEVMVPGRVVRDFVWNVSRRVDGEVCGTVPWHPAMHSQQVARGRFFGAADMDARASVCVLEAGMAARLFPFEEALGRDVRVGAAYYRVIGVLEGRSASGAGAGEGGGQAAGRMFVPLTTARMRYGNITFKNRTGSFEAERVQLHEVTLRVADQDRVLAVADAVKALLERHHKKKDWEMVVPLELLRQAERTKEIFNVVLGSIAAISLLVGGIGIMNIMLATVTERTREIGIRRALGARRRDVMSQFLVESVLLSGAGGLLGVGLGLAIPALVSHLAGLKTIVVYWSPLLAFGISGLVGVLFGLYPARQAALMDPVEALRHE